MSESETRILTPTAVREPERLVSLNFFFKSPYTSGNPNYLPGLDHTSQPSLRPSVNPITRVSITPFTLIPPQSQGFDHPLRPPWVS